MAKKVKLSAKIALDIIMFVALIFLYKAKVLTLTYHEVMGLGIALFFLVHCLFNRTWIVDTGKKLFSKSTPARTKFGYWITILLVIDFLLIIVSGIFISKIIFRDAISSLNLGDTSIFRNIHLFCSVLSLILIGIHVGIYWPMVKGFFAKRINLPKRVGTTLAYVLLAVIVATGVYSPPTSSFTNWLTSPFVQQTGHDHGHGDQTASGDATVSASASASASSSAKSGHGDAASVESTSDASNAKSANASNHGNVITPQNIITTFYQYT